jgi:hypothetical protein
MTLYVDGKQYASQNYKHRKETKTVTVFVTPPSVVAVRCYSSHRKSGILVSASTDIVSDGSWRCSKSIKKQTGWNLVSIARIYLMNNIVAYI